MVLLTWPLDRPLLQDILEVLILGCGPRLSAASLAPPNIATFVGLRRRSFSCEWGEICCFLLLFKGYCVVTLAVLGVPLASPRLVDFHLGSQKLMFQASPRARFGPPR